MFWLLITLLAAAFIAALVLPLLRGKTAPAPEAGGPQAVLAERLGEIARDRASGLLTQTEAEDAEIEAKRAALKEEAQEAARREWKSGRLAGVFFAGLAPVAALWLYVTIGAPAIIGADAPPPETAGGPVVDQAMIETMVSGLAARLEENPEDADGWRMLARSYAVLNRPADSAAAWRELLSRVEGDVEDWRGYLGALLAAGPDATPEEEIVAAAERLDALNPGDPMALYFMGLKARADGDNATAAARWRALLDQLPPDAPVRGQVESLIAEAEAAAKE